MQYTMDDAYCVRRKFVDLMIADGRLPKGHKIGFTSEAIQRQYGMTGPDFGQLLDDVFVPAGQPVPASTLSDARVEAEIAADHAAHPDLTAVVVNTDDGQPYGDMAAALDLVYRYDYDGAMLAGGPGN